RGRRRAVVLAALLAGLVAGGAVFAAMQYAGGGRDVEGTGRTTTATAPTTTPSAKVEGNKGIPEGWHRVDDPEGFSLLVPDGWKRQITDGQIDYTPDGGNHRIRISVDRSPDFESPYVHALDLEGALGKRMHYKRIQLSQKVYRDQTLSCLWEFTWTEKKNFPGPRHAIDQMYYGDDGTEYAVYMSSPESSWETTRKQFDIVLRHWRETGEQGAEQTGG
ncbi:serine/threonine protein kinase, partial [Streptomyces sp. SID2131]|nr:serine/threonine protein kinase [Streptomyces sp. SID2131]